MEAIRNRDGLTEWEVHDGEHDLNTFTNVMANDLLWSISPDDEPHLALTLCMQKLGVPIRQREGVRQWFNTRFRWDDILEHQAELIAELPEDMR